MENSKSSSSKVSFKWALICFITSIVLTYAFQFANMSLSVVAKIVGYIPFIVFLFLAQKEYKDQNGGYMKFGEGFVTGLLYSVFNGLLFAVFMFIYFKYLSPQIWEQSLAEQKDKMVAQGNLSEDQIETAMNILRSYGAAISAVTIAIGTPIVGAI